MFKKIMVCLDGSELAEQILPYAAEQARHFNSDVVMFQAITKTDAVSIPKTPTGETLPQAAQPSLETALSESDEAKEYLSKQASKLRHKGLHVQTVAIFDPVPGKAIVEYAWEHDIDLITMATHGRGGISRAISGSVADHVLRESRLPILMIRPRESQG